LPSIQNAGLRRTGCIDYTAHEFDLIIPVEINRSSELRRDNGFYF